MCRSSAAVKLLASESDGRGFESRRQLFFLFFFFFFFFFSNIHTSDKLEIFFDHSILVNGVDPWGVHRFLGGINHENGIYSMGQRHECGLGYIIITIYEVLSLQNRVSEWVSAFSPPAILVSLHSRVKICCSTANFYSGKKNNIHVIYAA